MSTEKKTFPDDWNPDNVVEIKDDAADPFLPEVITPKEAESLAGGLSKKVARGEAVSEHRERMAVIRKFVQALNEISPLVDVASGSEPNKEEFKEKISKLFALQNIIVKTIENEWELESENVSDRYVLSIVAKQTSNLIKDGLIQSDNDKEKVIEILSKIDDFVNERPYIGQLIESNQLSDDVLVNIKTSLFPASLKFSELLRGLGAKETTVFKWVKWHNNLTINLAKDLAFNWDKNGTFKDRERLFESCLKQCAEITHDTWVQYFMKGIKTDLTSYDDVSLWNNLSEFEAVVKECDMGYLDHEIYSIDWLKNQICEHITNKASQFKALDSTRADSYKVQLYFVDQYCKASAQAWFDASQEMISELEVMLEKLSDEEKQKWFEEEGSKPMPLSKVYSKLESGMQENIFEEKINLNETEMLKTAKGRLAQMWGLSDAVCKIKRKK